MIVDTVDPLLSRKGDVLFPTPNGDQSQASLTLGVDGCSSHVNSTVVRKTVAQMSILANVGSEGSSDEGKSDGPKLIQRCVTTGYSLEVIETKCCHQYCK